MSTTPIETKRRLEASEFQVAWVSALEIEYSAARALLDEEFQPIPRKAGDPNKYALGRIGNHNVVIVRLPEGIIGNNAAATVVANLSTSFPTAKIGLMVGIGGGVPSDDHDIRLGDVVISKPSNEDGGVVQYDLGKATTGDQFQRIGHLNKPQPLLLHALVEVKSNHTLGKGTYSTHLDTLQKIAVFTRPKAEPDRLFKSTYPHQQGSTCARCDTQMLVNRVDRPEEVKFYYGTIASGNQVMKDAEKRDRISLKLRGILCFEMEAAGLDNLNCLVIRGICDYADSHKNEKWQSYAAATAAAYAKEILLVIPPEDVKNAPPIQAPFMVPFLRNELFTGRDTILQQLKDALSQRLGCPYSTIHGVGGCGKSAVALEFLYQVRDQHPDRSIFWVPAISAIEFEAAYRKIAQLLHLPGATDPNTNVLKVVKEALSRDDAGSWLMVVDNADDLDVFQTEVGSEKQTSRLKDSLPNSPLGMVVFTSRSRKTADSLSRGGLIPLDRMTTDEARNCLCQILQKPELFQNDKAVSELLKALSFLPLAIIQAAAYMVQNDTTVQEYLGLYEKTNQAKIWALCKEFDDDRRYKTSNNAVAITWYMSFQKIREDDATAASYLAFIACIAPERIPLSDFFPDSQGFEGKEAIGTLVIYGFITRERDSGLYDMHQLVHLATRNWLNQEGQWSTWIGKVLDRLLEMIPNGGLKGREQYVLYLLDGIYASHLPTPEQQGKAVTLLEHIGRCQRDLGEYRKAGASWNLILESRERILGPKDPATLSAMHEVGFFLNLQGNYEEAESLYKKTIALREEVLGEEHENTISSMHNLAQVLSNQGRYVPAEDMYKKTLDLAKKFSGPNTKLTLATTANLAGVLDKQGRYLEAEKLHQEAVQLKEMALGKDDPETLSSMSNLALTYWNQGRWNEAEELEVQVKETRLRVLGPEHPDTLTSQANLATTYRNQGRWNKAEELEVQVIETRLRVLGPEHPDTLTSQANLASTYQNQNRWKEAEQLFVQVMETRLRVLGPEHPDTLTSQANLATTYRNQVRWKEAEQLFVQVMETRLRVLGPEHPDTLTSMNYLAGVFGDRGNYAAAERLYRDTLSLAIKVLGPEHPSTLRTMNNMAQVIFRQGNYNDAERLYRNATSLRIKSLGLDHPDTQDSLRRMQDAMEQQARAREISETPEISENLQSDELYEIINQYGNHAIFDDESDTESVFSDVSAMSSISSISDNSVNLSPYNIELVTVEILLLLTSDRSVRASCKTILRRGIEQARFKNNLRNSLKRFSQKLGNESSDYLQTQIANFIRVYANGLAQRIYDSLHSSGYLQPDPLLKNIEQGVTEKQGKKDSATSENKSQEKSSHESQMDQTTLALENANSDTEDSDCEDEIGDGDGDFQQHKYLSAQIGQIKILVSESRAFAELQRDLHRFAVPSLLNDIKQVMTEAFASSSPTSPSCQFRLSSGIKEFCENELEGSFDLFPVLVVTGRKNGQAFMTTCSQYVERYWSQLGIQVLIALQEALVRGQASTKSVEIQLHIQVNQKGDFVVDTKGSQNDMISVAQVLSWICSQFRMPLGSKIAYSDVLFTVEKDGSFNIHLADLLPVSSRNPPCWNDMITSTIISRGFPIPRRLNEIGLEVPFDIMILVAGILYPLEVENGLVLKGYYTALIPTKDNENSIQWHFKKSKSEDRMTNISELIIDSNFAKIKDFSHMASARSFVGHWPMAQVKLGTEDSDYSIQKNWSGAVFESASHVAEEASITAGVSKIATLSGTIKLRKQQGLSVRAHKLPFEYALEQSSSQPLILYDVRAKRGWLVPEINVVLHLALAKLRERRPSSNIELPFIKGSGISGEDGLRATTTLLLSDESSFQDETNKKLVQKAIKWIITELALRRELVEGQSGKNSIKLRNLLNRQPPNLLGWEIRDLSTISHFPKRSQVHIDDHMSAGWPKIAAAYPQIIVLFGSQLGHIIQPADQAQLCNYWRALPQDCYRLMASVQCLNLIRESGRLNPSGCYYVEGRYHLTRTHYLIHSSGGCECNRGQNGNFLLSLSDQGIGAVIEGECGGAIMLGHTQHKHPCAGLDNDSETNSLENLSQSSSSENSTGIAGISIERDPGKLSFTESQNLNVDFALQAASERLVLRTQLEDSPIQPHYTAPHLDPATLGLRHRTTDLRRQPAHMNLRERLIADLNEVDAGLI